MIGHSGRDIPSSRWLKCRHNNPKLQGQALGLSRYIILHVELVPCNARFCPGVSGELNTHVNCGLTAVLEGNVLPPHTILPTDRRTDGDYRDV